MTVLSRSKNAAPRVTRHDCKRTRPAWRGSPAVHTPRSHPQFGARPSAGHGPGAGLGRMPVPPVTAVRPLVASSDEQLLDDLRRVLAAAGAEPELATGGPALRRAHRDAPL